MEDSQRLLVENSYTSTSGYEDDFTTNRSHNLDGIQSRTASADAACSIRQRSRDKQNIPQKITPGSQHYLSTAYESLDYDTSENHLLLEEERGRSYKDIVHINISRWIIFIAIGVLTALVACFIDICIQELSERKYGFLKASFDKYVVLGQLWIPLLFWVGTNVGPVLIGSALVTYVEPVAAGSGIPLIKCYLNGIKMPRVARVKTLLVKVIGVILSVVGGLAGGKEGPMIHSGAIIAAGISQGKSTTLKTDFKIFQNFRQDHEKRDFVSGGAAAGVAAAFGAPVGGVLFSLEEGCSFWNQNLTWQSFLASVVSSFTLNFVLSYYNGYKGKLTYPGLLNFGGFESLDYEIYELPIFLFMGMIGGLSGALWNHLNYQLAIFRKRYVVKRPAKVFEACLVAALTAAVASLIMFFDYDCKPLGQDPTKYPVQLQCDDGEYNALAAIWFQTPEASVRALFHDPMFSHRNWSLALIAITYFFLSCFTFGLSVSVGLFIPNLLIGAAWGRLVSSVLLVHILPNHNLVNIGKYAIIGAAAQLGGVVRMTLSLTVILTETTGDITFSLPLIMTVIMAKWTGDFFNEGIYDTLIRFAGVPILDWGPPLLSSHTYATEVMSHPVVTLKTVENVGHIVELLRITTYNGFPVVDPPLSDTPILESYGKIRGLILRSQLVVLLNHKLYNDEQFSQRYGRVTTNLFRDEYPRFPTIEDVEITDEERTKSIDLRPYMNLAPHTVVHSTSLPRMFRLFRALGLRHLPVVNDANEVVGMVTRKDLARYRMWYHHGRIGMDQLIIVNE